MKPEAIERLIAARRDPKSWEMVKDAFNELTLVQCEPFIMELAKRMGIRGRIPPWFRCWAVGVPYTVQKF